MYVNREQGLQLIGPVMALHAAAFLLGYVLCKVLGFNEKTARTVSIETGEYSSPAPPSTVQSILQVP